MTTDDVFANLDRIGATETAARVSKSYGVRLEDLLGYARQPTVSAARHHLWLLVKHTLDLSYPEVGGVFERDAATVRTGIQNAEARLGLRVPDRHVAGLSEDLAQDAGVGVEAEQAKGLGRNLAEDYGRQEGAAGPSVADSGPSHRLEGAVG